MPVCPSCKDSVDENSELCLNCGEPLDPVQLKAQGQPLPAPRASVAPPPLRPPGAVAPQPAKPGGPPPLPRPKIVAPPAARRRREEEPEAVRCKGCGAPSKSERCPGCGAVLRRSE